MKRLISVSLSLFIILVLFPLCAFASENNSAEEAAGQTIQRIVYADGSSLEIITAASESVRAVNTKTGTRIYNKRTASGALEWTAALTATFTYNGTTATCTSASCSVTIYDSSWSTVSNSTTRSGNTATTHLTMSYSPLGITPVTRSYTITLSCDANGNLS